MISEVANTYAKICSFQQKKNIAEQVTQIDGELLKLFQGRLKGGLSNRLEIEQAKALLEADKAQLDVIDAALKQAIYSMSILLGMLPEETIALFQTERPIPHAEGRIPAGMPSELLRRRPDIAKAERQLAAATEQIGVAVAAYFPLCL